MPSRVILRHRRTQLPSASSLNGGHCHAGSAGPFNSGQVTIGSVSTSDDGREAILRRAATIDPCALKTDGGLVPLVSALASAYGIFATCTMVVTMEFRGLAGLAFRLAALAGLLFIRLSRSTDDATDYFQFRRSGWWRWGNADRDLAVNSY